MKKLCNGKKFTKRDIGSAEKGLRIVLNKSFSLREINVYFFYQNCLPSPCVHFTKSYFRVKFHFIQEKVVPLYREFYTRA